MLAKLDRVQTSFLEEIHSNDETGFLYYNFAPPVLRRDIGILGFLHKRVLGIGPPALAQFLPFSPLGSHWHNKQLDSHLDSCTTLHALHERSIFGMIHVYNRLHQSLIDILTVSEFKTELTSMARARCRRGDPEWKWSFHSSAQIWLTRREMD